MKQLDPRGVWVFFIKLVFQWLLLIIFLVVIFGPAVISLWDDPISDSGMDITPVVDTILSWSLVFILPFLVLCFIWAKLIYNFYRYELTDAGFRKELGVISKKYVTIPYDRIQNVDIYRGVIARVFGLSDLSIQTAGMSGVSKSEGSLPSLSREVAEQIRDDLVSRINHSKGQGL